MTTQPRRCVAARLAALGAGLVLLAGLLSGAIPASAAPLEDCPVAMPLSELAAAIEAAPPSDPVTGTGYTVARGTEPEPFNVEFLALMSDPFLPARTAIIVEASSPAIDRAGGIWAGMSGSPVYIGDRLVGAVAFSVGSEATLGGLTPAEDMLDVLRRGSVADVAAASSLDRDVTLSARTVRQIARATGRDEASIGTRLSQLRVPLSVSGLGERGMKGLRHFLKTNDLEAVPYSGASVSTSTVAPGSIEPGGNFAAALSYGDITYAAIGTTTLVCNGAAMAFGHPLFWEGKTMIGANSASVIAIARDSFFGPFKLARVEGVAGTVDQDRHAGLRADLDSLPVTVPITATADSLDDARGARRGQTHVVFGQDVTHLSLDHILVNVLAVQDEINEGSASMSWTVRGVTESGTEWRLARSNRYTSRFGIAFEVVDELHWLLHRIEDNRFEPIDYTSVSATVEVESEVRQFAVADVLARVGGRYRDVTRLRVRPGARISLRVRLEPFDGTRAVTRRLTVRVPKRARGLGMLRVGRVETCFNRCAYWYAGDIDSFAELLRAEARQPRNTDLVAQLNLGRRGAVVSRDRASVAMVVAGGKRIAVEVGRRG